MEYFFAENGQQRGPYPPEQLAAQGMKRDSLVWAEGMPDWVPAHTVPALQAVLNPSAAAAAPGSAVAAAGPFPGSPMPAAGYAPPTAAYAPPAAAYAPPAAGYPPHAYVQPGYAPPTAYMQPAYGYTPQDVSGKKIGAGICALLLGGFGIHKFILGLNTAGIIYLLVSIVGGVLTCGAATGVMGIIALIEGIIYLTKNDEQFYVDYMVNKKQWF